MKRVVLLFAVLIAFTYLTTAQLTQPYTAREGEQVTRNKAAKTMADPELFIIATVSGQFEGVPIKLDFDEETGEATAWIYIYNGKIDGKDTSLSYVALKTLMGMSALEINLGDFGTIPFDPETGVDEVEWINSDKMMEVIRDNSEYRDFLDVFPDTKFTMGALLTEPMQNNTIWAVMFMTKDSTRLNCMVDAVSTKTICQTMQTDVETAVESGKLGISPNPVSELAVLSVPIEFVDDNADLRIYDSMGNLMLDRNGFDISSDGQIALSLGNLPQGVYNLLYIAKGKVLRTRFVVVK